MTKRRRNAWEDQFRRWLLSQVVQNVEYPYDAAKFDGAEVVGCSSETARRYLKKMCSAYGPLMMITPVRQGTRRQLVILRQPVANGVMH